MSFQQPRRLITMPNDRSGRPTEGFRPKNSRPRPEKRWSHQDDLDTMVGQQIIVRDLRNELTQGKLAAADQFTIKLEIGPGVYAIYFKSSLASFWMAQ